jgi:hypothetical protein
MRAARELLGNALSTMLFGLTPPDAWTYATLTATLIIVSTVASAVPSHRVTRVDPVHADLRHLIGIGGHVYEAHELPNGM